MPCGNFHGPCSWNSEPYVLVKRKSFWIGYFNCNKFYDEIYDKNEWKKVYEQFYIINK
jgi:hypothetical protein